MDLENGTASSQTDRLSCDMADGYPPSPTEGHDMTGTPSRLRQIFFEVFETLPRQGPGNRASAAKALALCRDLPPSPAVIDLGCGVGGQTLHLAELLPGAIITALDRHAPSIERLRSVVAIRGLAGRIQPMVRDMANPGLPPASFDLVWSEGALYNIGIESALQVCSGLLRAGGYLAFTDAVWRKENPPPEVKASFEDDYPAMGRVPDVLAAIKKSGFSLIGHFTLPDEAWWDDFYTPMEIRIEELRTKYGDDDEALAVLDQLAQEPIMHQRYSDYYAYEFFVVRRMG
jgi:SAM-dependent methyltransferase